jgi:hypothetical protein
MVQVRRAEADALVMSDRENIPQVENVDLVAKSSSNAGAPGFRLGHSLGLSLGLLLMFLITYLVFG